MEMVKAMSLGASLNGLSSQFMHMALDDVDQAIETINQWKIELTHIMTLLGAKRIEDLRKSDVIITGETAQWCAARKINLQKYASRS